MNHQQIIFVTKRICFLFFVFFKLNSVLFFTFRLKRTVQKTSWRIVQRWTLNQRALIISYSTSPPQGDEAFSSFDCVLLMIIPLVDVLLIYFLPLLFQFKKCHKQRSRRGQVCFWAEHVRTSFGKCNTVKMKSPNPVQLGSLNKVVLCGAFRVLRRAIAQMRKIKTFQLPKPQSPHHRKAPKRRVSAPQGMLTVDAFLRVTQMPSSDKRKMKQSHDSAPSILTSFVCSKSLCTINRELCILSWNI